jgi:hypothetical protein
VLEGGGGERGQLDALLGCDAGEVRQGLPEALAPRLRVCALQVAMLTMKSDHVLAAFILTVSSTLLSASCLQDSTAPEPERGQVQSSNGSEPSGEAQQEASGARFMPEEFVFVIEHDWDGKDEAGGWQIAYNTSEYASKVNGRVVYTWRCRLLIGMPRHSEKAGDISTRRAAELSAEVMNAVTWPLLNRQEAWAGQGEAFCAEQLRLMQDLFRSSRYQAVGARVSRP